MKLYIPVIKIKQKNISRNVWYWIILRGLQHPIFYARHIPEALENAYYDLPIRKAKETKQ